MKEGGYMALTPKQEKFCENIASGKDGIESYMSAYNCNSRSAANVESTKLMKRDDITERITEIRKPILNLVQNKQISERQQQIDAIQNRIAICIDKGDETSLIRYYDMLNKIYALYKENEITEKQDNPVEKLDTSLLKRLSGL